jgi:hypothetical protein
MAEQRSREGQQPGNYRLERLPGLRIASCSYDNTVQVWQAVERG